MRSVWAVPAARVCVCLVLQGWMGHVDGQPHPVPVTALLAAAVDLVLSFEQCLGKR